MRSILRFAFVVVPTAVLATAVVVGVSRSGQGAAGATSDGDLQRDLKLASATNLELAPAGQALATISAIEAPPAATPDRAVRPKRSPSGTRALRSRTPTVKAAPEPQVAESVEESETTESVESAGAPTEAAVVAPAEGGVALPRPTAIPVSYPGDGGGTAGGDVEVPRGGGGGGGGVYGGPVIRGGGVDGDRCQIHGGVFGRRPPIFRQPSLGDRIRATQPARERPRSIGDRVRGSQASGSRGSSIGDRVRSSQGGGSSSGGSRGSLGDRIRAARGR